MAASIRRTKIVATLGPASSSPEMIAKLIEAGVNVFRLNFSHGKQSEHAECIRRIRAASSDGCGCVGILQDLQGPKIRVGPMVDRKPILLEAGKRLRIVTSEVQGTPDLISTTYEPLPDDVRPGDMILLDDGRLQVRVVAKEGRAVVVEVVIGGLLGEHKGMNLPHTPLSAPCLTAKDISDLRFGVAQGVDYIGLSFVRQAQDILEVRRLCREAGRDLPVVAKIERIEAIERLEEIVDAADAIMVARGDLGVETGPAEVPILQKQILDTAGCKGKPDITATQMLETMVENPLPSRAEATDVANAVFDGTDAVMLSAETAMGKYPVEAVRTMAQIAIHASQTGHLVFSTLHTNDAAGAITRLVDMGIEPFLIASSLTGTLAQRLVRRICPHCRVEAEHSAGALAELGLKPADGPFWRGAGCPACFGSGYLGRSGIYEMLSMDESIRELVLKRASAGHIRAAARQTGMRTLVEDGAAKVRRGVTTPEEVLRVVHA